MKRIKVGIALISMFGLVLGIASVANAKIAPLHHPKVSQISAKSIHQASQFIKRLSQLNHLPSM